MATTPTLSTSRPRPPLARRSHAATAAAAHTGMSLGPGQVRVSLKMVRHVDNSCRRMDSEALELLEDPAECVDGRCPHPSGWDLPPWVHSGWVRLGESGLSCTAACPPSTSASACTPSTAPPAMAAMALLLFMINAPGGG